MKGIELELEEYRYRLMRAKDALRAKERELLEDNLRDL